MWCDLAPMQSGLVHDCFLDLSKDEPPAVQGLLEHGLDSYCRNFVTKLTFE